MYKSEIIIAISERTGLKEAVSEKVLKAFIEVVTEALIKGEKVQLAGFGTFEVFERSARQGRNPFTGDTMIISASKIPKFRAGKTLKTRINA